MPMKPDMFLLIVVTSGVCILIVGIIIVINCPLEAVSFSHCYKKICEIIRRRKRKINTENDILPSKDITSSLHGNKKNYGETLVEGRPQGQGFYTAGPWTSTDTCSTALSTGGDALQKITIMTQMGIFASAMMSAAGINNSTSAAETTSNSDSSTFYSNFLNFDSPEHGLQGDNSSALYANLHSPGGIASVCMNCEGSGYLNNSQIGQPAILHVPVVAHHLDSSSASMDSALEASDMDTDADMMIMCM